MTMTPSSTFLLDEHLLLLPNVLSWNLIYVESSVPSKEVGKFGPGWAREAPLCWLSLSLKLRIRDRPKRIWMEAVRINLNIWNLSENLAQDRLKWQNRIKGDDSMNKAFDEDDDDWCLAPTTLRYFKIGNNRILYRIQYFLYVHLPYQCIWACRIHRASRHQGSARRLVNKV